MILEKSDQDSLVEEYSSLVSLCRLYLDEDYKNNTKIYTDNESYQYYRTWAQKQKKAAPAITQPSRHTTATIPHKQTLSINKPQIDSPLVESQAKKNLTEDTIPVPSKSKDVVKPREKEVKTSQAPSFFQLEPMKYEDCQSLETSDIKKFLSERFPRLPLIDTIPKDEITVVQNSYQIIILCKNENSKEKAFLENLSIALKLRNYEVVLAAYAQLPDYISPSLKLIIAAPSSSKGGEELKKQALSVCFIDSFEKYFKNPALKKHLWDEILVQLEKCTERESRSV